MEMVLVWTLALFLRTDRGKALILYFAAESIEKNRRLLQRFNHQQTQNENDKKELDQILNDLRSRNEERNKFVHAFWYGPKSEGGEMHRFRNTLPTSVKKGFYDGEVITVQMIEAEIEEVRLLNKRLEKWLFLVLKNDPEAMEIMGYREYGN